MSERDEQVKRLAEALTSGAHPSWWAQEAARRAYDAGARIPDPPAPVLPVVSEAAWRAYQQAVCMPGGDGMIATGLRAAFPIMLRESLDALPRQQEGTMARGKFRLPPTRTCSAVYLDDEQLAALFAAVTGRSA